MTDENKSIMNLDQPKPHSDEAEQIVIASILQTQHRRRAFNSLWGVDKPFYNPKHEEIFNVMNLYDNEFMSLQAMMGVKRYIQEKSSFEKCGGEEYVKCLHDMAIDNSILDNALWLVIHYAKLRNIIALCTETIQQAYNNEGSHVLTKNLVKQSEIIEKNHRTICYNCKYAHFASSKQDIECRRNSPKMLENSAPFPIMGFCDSCGEFELKLSSK